MNAETRPCLEAPLSVELLERMAAVLKLLAHPQRLKIIEILERDTALPVFELMQQLDLPQAATSHHLNAMKRVGLLTAERRGKEVWYSIADPRALTILSCIRQKGAATP
jgi:DNA-binding transcriptional ArsR family regulator